MDLIQKIKNEKNGEEILNKEMILLKDTFTEIADKLINSDNFGTTFIKIEEKGIIRLLSTNSLNELKRSYGDKFSLRVMLDKLYWTNIESFNRLEYNYYIKEIELMYERRLILTYDSKIDAHLLKYLVEHFKNQIYQDKELLDLFYESLHSKVLAWETINKLISE